MQRFVPILQRMTLTFWIFKAIKKVNDQNFITRRLVKLIQADISYYAMHTNFDSAPGCMADLAAERIGICGGEPLEAMGEDINCVIRAQREEIFDKMHRL